MKRCNFLSILLLICLTLPSCNVTRVAHGGLSPTATSSTPTVVLSTAFSASNVGRIIEQIPSGVVLPRLEKGKIMASEFSPDGQRFGVITPLGVYIYDTATLNQKDFIPSSPSPQAAAFSPDWSVLAIGSGSTVIFERLASRSVAGSLETQQGKVSRLLFSPDGSLLAVFVTPPGEEIYSQVVELWNIADRKILSTWEVSVYDNVFFTPDSKAFYAWNVSQGLGVRRWKIPSGASLPAWTDWDGAPYPAAFSPDGKLYAATTASTVSIQRVSDRSQISTLSIGAAQYVSLLRFSSDSSLLAGAMNDSTIRVWRVADGDLLDTFNTDSTAHSFLAISPDNKTLAIPTLDGITLYSVNDGSILGHLSGHLNSIEQAVISPKGDKAAALVEGSGLFVWDLIEGKLIYSLSGVDAYSMAWSPDSTSLVLGEPDGSLQILRSTDGTKIRNIIPHSGTIAQVLGLAFSPDGSLLASSSMFSIKLWHFADGTLVRDIRVAGGWVTGVRFSPDGKYLTAASADEKVRVWRVMDGQQVAELAVPHLSGDKEVIAFVPDSDILAIGEISQIDLWRFTDSKPFDSMPLGGAQVITLRISPDGSLLACGMTDGTIQFRQIPEGRLLSTVRGGGEGVVSLDFSVDGQILLSASGDGTIRIWKVAK